MYWKCHKRVSLSFLLYPPKTILRVANRERLSQVSTNLQIIESLEPVTCPSEEKFAPWQFSKKNGLLKIKMQRLTLFLITGVNFLTQSIEIKRQNSDLLTPPKKLKPQNSFYLKALIN